MNGMRETVKRIDATLATHVEADHAVQVTAVATSARIEEKCEGMCERLDDLRDRVDLIRKTS